MKKSILLLLALLTIADIAMAQMKPALEAMAKNKPSKNEIRPLEMRTNPVAVPRVQRSLYSGLQPRTSTSILPSLMPQQKTRITRDENGQVIFIEGTLPEIQEVKEGKEQDYYQQALQYLDANKANLQIKEPEDEFALQRVEQDELGHTHIRLQQTHQGIEVYAGELILHNVDGKITHASGRIYPTPTTKQLNPSLSQAAAIEVVKSKLSETTVIKELSEHERQWMTQEAAEAKLIIYHTDRKLDTERLAWKINIIPHLGQHWNFFIDAQTGEILHNFNQICRLHDQIKPEHIVCSGHHKHEHTAAASAPVENLLGGPATAQAVDLNGITRTIQVYEQSGTYYMVDASRPMFRNSANVVASPTGAIVTVDAQNQAPQSGGFQLFHNQSPNNSWGRPVAVSAHYNASVAYEYYRTKFNRNSIDGSGGNVISVINVVEDGQAMDNAFWDGQAIYYGNGDRAFSPLAKSLDVAGHEMSHGVVQHTAGLEYFAESGALNESFADIFGAMMDRDDWKIGEDIVNQQFFPTGAMRDMQNPNNGGSSINTPGWQPANTSEQYFGQEDNGGVHINSGIVNRAYYLFATEIGKDKAEQIYYRALSQYLTRSSQFIDTRLAVIQAAKDRHGNNSAEVSAAERAFNQVGIGSGGGSGGGGNTGGGTNLDALCGIQTNPGTEFVLLTDANNSALYLANANGELIQNPLLNVGIKSKPSITDDGTFVVFVAEDGTLRYIDFNAGEADFLENEPQNIWRNAVISKDGSRLAALSNDMRPEVLIFDFVSGQGQVLEFTTPTTAEGISTSSIDFADAMEWDYDGEFLIYDAFNTISSGFGEDIQFWNINFLKAWDKNSNSFGDGLVLNLFASLPENISIGNPTLSKNSSCVVAFDLLDTAEGTFEVYGVNYEKGDVSTIFEGNTAGYPSYSKVDDAVVFDFLNEGERILAVQTVGDDKITPSGDAFIFIPGGSWGVVFSDGTRTITNTQQIGEENVRVYPTAFQDELHIEWNAKQGIDATAELYDMLGRRVLQQSLDANTILETANLNTGAYFLTIQIGEARSTQKLIKIQ